MKVSVCVITYNHENYIEECLQSIIRQKINFECEIIVGEDGSNDQTRSRIQELQNKYPGSIYLLPDEGNKGMLPNFIRTLEICKGDYVAICEGDDYWIDPSKLQKQIDFLDAHLEYIACYTDIQHLNEVDGKTYDVIQHDIDEIGIEDLFSKNYVTTMTAVYRNRISKFPESFKTLLVGDWPLFVLHAQYGKIKRLPFISGVYRIHSSNNFQANSYLTKKEKMTQATEFLYENLNDEFKLLAKNKLVSSYYILSCNHLSEGNIEKAYFYYNKMKNLPGIRQSKEYILLTGKLFMNKYLSFG